MESEAGFFRASTAFGQVISKYTRLGADEQIVKSNLQNVGGGVSS